MTDQPMMPHLKDLPHLFQTIRQHKLPGRLTWIDGEDKAHIFFDAGYPIHAQVDMYGQIGEDAIDWVLTRHQGNFQWASADEHFKPAHTITSEMSENFDRLIIILVEGEILNHPPDEDYDLTFFGIQPTAEAPPEPAPRILQPNPILLRFPPGEVDTALSESLAELDFSQQIITLEEQQFTGYLYYQPAQGNEFMALGMVLFEQGSVSLAYATELITDTSHTGNAALQQLSPQAKHVIAYRSVAHILQAFRGIIQATQRNPKPATRESLQHTLATIKQRQMTGAVLLQDSERQQEAYLLFNNGQMIGLVAPETGSNRLVQLPQNAPLPVGTPHATLTILATPTSANAIAPVLAPDMYATLVQSFQIMGLLATQVLGQERAAAILNDTFHAGIEQGSIPSAWQRLIQAKRAAIAWPASVSQLGSDTAVLNGLTFLWDQVYTNWSQAIGPQFLSILLRAWGNRIPTLQRAPIKLPFAEQLGDSR